MAEIRIQKNKNNNILPWLILALGLVILAWLAVDFFDKDVDSELLTADGATSIDTSLNNDLPDSVVLSSKGREANPENWVGNTAGFDDYYNYYLAAIERIDEDMSVEHEYSSTAIQALANSLLVLTEENDMKMKIDAKAKCETIKRKAVEITKDWKSTDHADKIRDAALSSVEIIKEIQMESYPKLKDEVIELENAAHEIKKGALAMEQKKEVKNFFKMTADVLEKMKKA